MDSAFYPFNNLNQMEFLFSESTTKKAFNKSSFFVILNFQQVLSFTLVRIMQGIVYLNVFFYYSGQLADMHLDLMDSSSMTLR